MFCHDESAPARHACLALCLLFTSSVPIVYNAWLCTHACRFVLHQCCPIFLTPWQRITMLGHAARDLLRGVSSNMLINLVALLHALELLEVLKNGFWTLHAFTLNPSRTCQQGRRICNTLRG